MSDIVDRGLSVYDVCLTPTSLFPLSISTASMLCTALASARIKPAIKSRLQQLLNTKPMRKALKCLYWLTLSKQFLPKTAPEVKQLLRKQLSVHYSHMLLTRLETKQEDFLHLVPIIFTHCICTDIYKRFSNSRSAFNPGFVLTVARMIHCMLFGVEASDVFISRKIISLYRSQVLGLDIAIKPTQEPDERKVSTSVLIKMKEVTGGLEFAKELYKLGDQRAKLQQSKSPQEETKTAGITEAKLEKVVRSYSVTRAVSAGGMQRLKPFDCSSLSPLLANQLISSSVSVI